MERKTRLEKKLGEEKAGGKQEKKNMFREQQTKNLSRYRKNTEENVYKE